MSSFFALLYAHLSPSPALLILSSFSLLPLPPPLPPLLLLSVLKALKVKNVCIKELRENLSYWKVSGERGNSMIRSPVDAGEGGREAGGQELTNCVPLAPPTPTSTPAL
eukprot:767187-Hanusia_phi.AAC.3